mmetsp:Transcript_1612/g.4761  ORF Transcript_1612/g.4761 Transcript_1612/m.4761 type:complete len:308 (-) Transcript_1612:1052-1975(-)
MGIDTVAAPRAEDTTRSGCVARSIHAIVSCGSTETRGEFRWPSDKTILCESKAQPSKIKLCTCTGSGDMAEPMRPLSKVATRWRLSMDTLRVRAVCCRKAFRKTSGLRKSLNVTPWSSMREEATRFTQSPFRASIRFAKPCKKTVGSSGADGHVAVQRRGTSARISAFASATTSGVLSAEPWITFCRRPSDAPTRSPSLPASIASIKTNATTGGSSGVTARTSMPLSFDSAPFDTFSQRLNKGPKVCFQALMSTLPPWPPPPAPPLLLAAVASCRSMVIAFVELMRCKERSAFGAIPKLCGLSMSGS